MQHSGSRSALIDMCAWWARPDVVSAAPMVPARSALCGSARHALIETHGDVSHPTLAPLTPAEVDAVLDAYTAWLHAEEWSAIPWRHEVALVYDTASDTAVELPRKEHRAYGALQLTEIPMTLDLLYCAGSVGYVADVKGSEWGDTQRVDENDQLAAQALAAARAFMLDEVHVYLLHVTENGVIPHECILNAAGLDAVAAKQRERVARIPNAQPQPGSHCTDLYCPAITICPRAQQTVALALPKDTPAGWATTAPTTPAHCLWKRDGAEFLEELAKQWRAESRAFADATNGVVLPDDSGRIWHRRDQTRETIDIDGPNGDRAEEALDRAGLGAAIEIKRSATKESIRKVLAARGLKGKALETELENVLVPIRVAGATRNATIPKYIEEKIK